MTALCSPTHSAISRVLAHEWSPFPTGHGVGAHTLPSGLLKGLIWWALYNVFSFELVANI